MKSPLLALLIAFALPLTSIAAPLVLSDRELTEGMLLGPISSTPQLKRAVDANASLLVRATERLGLTRDDFEAVRDAIDLGRARYVVLPQHLDAMAGEHAGTPFVVRNIVIPRNVHGWEVDLNRPDGLTRIFLPNRCGNISYLYVPRVVRVAAARFTPPPTPAPAPAPTATPVPVAVTTAMPIAVTPAPTIVHHPHLGWLAFLVVPAVLLLSDHHASNGGVPVPLPIHTACPTLVTIR